MRFGVGAGAPPGAAPAFTLDSAGVAGPSPVTALAAALAGCMAIDLVHILARGRHTLRRVGATLHADRADTEPRRFVSVTLHFSIAGSAPGGAVQRAIDLSRERYCSVWHSLRQDLPFQVTFELGD